MLDVLSLSEKTVLITGAGQGVGRQTALQCAEHGARVIVNDFHLDRARSVVDEIVAAGGIAIASQFDVIDFDSVTSSVNELATQFGAINILVNNAGNAGPVLDPMAQATKFWETNPDDWASWMGTSYYGVLNTTRAVLPAMVKRNFGRVITIISDAGRVGEPNLVVYGGAKAGAAGFSRGLAKAVGRYNITVNCIALSSMRTPGVATALENDEFVKKMLSNYPIRRLGEPTDAANLVLFLASGAAEWITGQTYPVNGGYSFAL